LQHSYNNFLLHLSSLILTFLFFNSLSSCTYHYNFSICPCYPSSSQLVVLFYSLQSLHWHFLPLLSFNNFARILCPSIRRHTVRWQLKPSKTLYKWHYTLFKLLYPFKLLKLSNLLYPFNRHLPVPPSPPLPQIKQSTSCRSPTKVLPISLAVTTTSTSRPLPIHPTSSGSPSRVPAQYADKGACGSTCLPRVNRLRGPNFESTSRAPTS